MSQIQWVDEALRSKIANLPSAPGVYLMKDALGDIIYIGKAKSLRARVRSYFQEGSSDCRPFVRLLDRVLADIEVIVVENEKEALLLENELIARHSPRYNSKQRGGRHFVYVRIDLRTSYPRLEVVRRREADGARYFGPYPLAGALRQTLSVINRVFHLRTCTHERRHRGRPCVLCQVSGLPGLSIYDMPEVDYRRSLEDAMAFLEGKDTGLLAALRDRMREAARSQHFEEAARLRDQIDAIEKTLLPQRVRDEHPPLEDDDGRTNNVHVPD